MIQLEDTKTLNKEKRALMDFFYFYFYVYFYFYLFIYLLGEGDWTENEEDSIEGNETQTRTDVGHNASILRIRLQTCLPTGRVFY